MTDASLMLAFSWQEFVSASSTTAATIVACLLIGIGLAGTLLPFIPGTVFVLAGALVHRLWLGGESGLTWTIMGVLTGLCLLAFLVDYIATALGAKWFGASGWGVVGAVFGGILGGIFFSIPGLILGPFVCAFVLEVLMSDRNLSLATQSTWGAFIGTVLGIMFKGAITLGMLALILLDVFRWN